MLEARTRLGAHPLHVQTATQTSAGGEARVLEAWTRLGVQPLRVQTATQAGAGGEARVLVARTRLGAQPLLVQSATSGDSWVLKVGGANKGPTCSIFTCLFSL